MESIGRASEMVSNSKLEIETRGWDEGAQR